MRFELSSFLVLKSVTPVSVAMHRASRIKVALSERTSACPSLWITAGNSDISCMFTASTVSLDIATREER